MHQRLLSWYRDHGRDLPWRHTTDPYRILVAEVMLQQTQVERVLPVYSAFLERFPTLEDLAQAAPSEAIRAWGPLGYNRRAVHLHSLARRVVEESGGRLPDRLEELLRLPGVGPYTARAVACFAFGQDVPPLDTNQRRVLSRLFLGLELPSCPQRFLEALAQAMLPRGAASAWNQALMDLGATVCTARRPVCPQCPVRDLCVARPLLAAVSDGAGRLADGGKGRTSQPFVGSRRYYRGRIVAALRELEEGEALDLFALGRIVKPAFSADDLPWLEGLLRDLQKDGLATLHLLCHGAPLAEATVALPARAPSESTPVPHA